MLSVNIIKIFTPKFLKFLINLTKEISVSFINKASVVSVGSMPLNKVPFHTCEMNYKYENTCKALMTILCFMFCRRNRPTVILPSSESFNTSLMRLKRELTLLSLRSTSYGPRAVMWGQRSVLLLPDLEELRL